MLSLCISSTKSTVKDECGRTFTGFRLYYEKDGKFKELRLSNNLPVFDKVEIYFQLWRYFLRLPISEKLRDVILRFMAHQHLVQGSLFDYYSFVCEYEKIQKDNHKCYLLDRWSIRSFRWWCQRVGDVVFLFDAPTKRDVRFCYAAIYLGFGRYLSVWGGGQLGVSTLRDMKRDFNATRVYKAIAK